MQPDGQSVSGRYERTYKYNQRQAAILVRIETAVLFQQQHHDRDIQDDAYQVRDNRPCRPLGLDWFR